MACEIHAKTQEENGAATDTQGCVPTPPVTTSEPGRRVDQPGTARLGELLCGRTFQRVLQLRERLGGKEGPAPYAARSEPSRLQLEAVE